MRFLRPFGDYTDFITQYAVKQAVTSRAVKSMDRTTIQAVSPGAKCLRGVVVDRERIVCKYAESKCGKGAILSSSDCWKCLER
jgi:hypothetical protein